MPRLTATSSRLRASQPTLASLASTATAGTAPRASPARRARPGKRTAPGSSAHDGGRGRELESDQCHPPAQPARRRDRGLALHGRDPSREASALAPGRLVADATHDGEPAQQCVRRVPPSESAAPRLSDPTQARRSRRPSRATPITTSSPLMDLVIADGTTVLPSTSGRPSIGSDTAPVAGEATPGAPQLPFDGCGEPKVKRNLCATHRDVRTLRPGAAHAGGRADQGEPEWLHSQRPAGGRPVAGLPDGRGDLARATGVRGAATGGLRPRSLRVRVLKPRGRHHRHAAAHHAGRRAGLHAVLLPGVRHLGEWDCGDGYRAPRRARRSARQRHRGRPAPGPPPDARNSGRAEAGPASGTAQPPPCGRGRRAMAAAPSAPKPPHGVRLSRRLQSGGGNRRRTVHDDEELRAKSPSAVQRTMAGNGPKIIMEGRCEAGPAAQGRCAPVGS